MSTKQLLVLLLAALASQCFSQMQFQHLTSADGISQSEVYSFLEDAQGFMWFGTVDGLNRYDGYRITTFKTDGNNPNSISNNTIRCLAEDHHGRVWIGTDDGLCVYDPRLERISQVPLQGFERNRMMINLALVDNGYLTLGTSLGLLRLDIQAADIGQIAQKAIQITVEENGQTTPVIAGKTTAAGTAWLITNSDLYLLRTTKDNKTAEANLVMSFKAIMPDLRNLEVDAQGNLWIVSHEHGFLRYNPKNRRTTHFKKGGQNPSIASNKYSSVTSDKNGDLWVGTHDNGLLFLEKKYLQHETPVFTSIKHDPYNDRSLNSNLVYTIYSSTDNLIWIGTIGSGINIYNPDQKAFQYYNLQNAYGQSSETNFIRAVYTDKNDFIWIGTHNNGLFILDKSNKRRIRKAGFDTEPIFHINDAGENDLLVCSGQGVSYVQLNNDRATIISNLSIGPTFYVSPVHEGIFWAATLHGIKKCSLANEHLEIIQTFDSSTSPALSLDNCRVLLVNNDTKELYVGTEGGGLNVLTLNENMVPVKNNIYKKDTTSNSLSNNYVRTIAQDTKGDVWVGTFEGLNQLHRSSSGETTISVYTEKDGLTNNTIQSIIEDDEGYLWMGTNNGLNKFNPKSKDFIKFTMNDGLQSNEFSEHTIYKNSDNEIIIGGINGINTFYPDEIVSSNVDPSLIITDFFLFNKRVDISNQTSDKADGPLTKSISNSDSILLEPKENSIGFEFAAIDFIAPEKIEYAYMLEGFDKDWTYTDANNRKANYTNLEYGDYTFMVKSTNSDGDWIETPKKIFISVKTPFYFTTVAFVLYGLLAIAGIYFFTNYSILRHTIKNKILLENQHNKRVRELEDLRNRFFINISHDLRTPLTLISSPLGVLLNSSQKKSEEHALLGLMQRNVNKLQNMTEQLLDISKIEAGNLSPSYVNLDIVSFIQGQAQFFERAFEEKGIRLDVTSEISKSMLSFDADMISKVMFNLLSNALKYTTQGSVKISIAEVPGAALETNMDDTHEHYVAVNVIDSGEGIAKEDLPSLFDRYYQGSSTNKKGYGIGLSHTKDLIDAHDGYIAVESEEGFGASFTFYLPKIQKEEALAGESTAQSTTLGKRIERSDNALPVFPKGETPESRNKTVLLVEDNVDLRMFMANELRKRYQVLEASDGAEGLAIASQDFPDLIVSDVMMPNMDGIEFCKEVKSAIKTSHIPVVLLTAKTDKETKYKGLEIGADDYIGKPFDVDFLLLRIQNLLKNRDRMRELFRENLSFEPTRLAVTSLDEEFLTKLLIEIEKGLPDSSFAISDLEQEMGMSHASFYSKVKGLTGQSAKELVLSMRMKRAKQLIEDTSNIRISEVAYMVGFSDPKYFSKSFKGYFGKSPSSYAKK